jgi:hypothetical protein
MFGVFGNIWSDKSSAFVDFVVRNSDYSARHANGNGY